MGGGDALFSKIDAGVRACKVTPLFLKAVKGDSTLRTLHLESKFLETKLFLHPSLNFCLTFVQIFITWYLIVSIKETLILFTKAVNILVLNPLRT